MEHWIITPENRPSVSGTVGRRTYSSPEETEYEGGDDEPRVPVMLGANGRQTEEHEDDSLHGLSHHFDKIFNRIGSGYGDVPLDVLLHNHTAYGNSKRVQSAGGLGSHVRNNGREGDHLRGQVGHVREDEDKDRGQDTDLGRIGVLGGQGGYEGEDDPDEHSSDGDDEEGEPTEGVLEGAEIL